MKAAGRRPFQLIFPVYSNLLTRLASIQYSVGRGDRSIYRCIEMRGNRHGNIFDGGTAPIRSTREQRRVRCRKGGDYWEIISRNGTLVPEGKPEPASEY